MWEDGGRVTARAVVAGVATVRWRGSKSLLTAKLRIDGRHQIVASWFSQHYLRGKLTDGRILTVTGKWNAKKRMMVVSETSFDAINPHTSSFLPIYHGSQQLGSRQIHHIILKALDVYAPEIDELVPFELTEKYRLCSHRTALFAMHKPDDEAHLRQARRRLAFEEFLLFQLQLHWFRQHSYERKGVKKYVDEDSLSSFKGLLPATLTDAQIRACQDILHDLNRDQMMVRLLQGDVGSGKTWVALFAVYSVVSKGYQAAVMAPTEILAEQHAREAQKILQQAGIRWRLLTGSTPRKDRDSTLVNLAAGEVDVLIGTHALLVDDVAFSNLGLVVTDEQHRFGVSQRSGLRTKGDAPDVLMLSATPIPRTLALAVYGDVDVSTLNERPKGRLPIQTVAYSMAQEEKALRLIRRALTAGQQAYIVAPTIEESDTLDAVAVTALYERLTDKLAGFELELLHGRMRSKDKDATMRRFRDGVIQGLVSTTVIEVGIDVPNATVMLIYNAERFGLAQLHQLRGRVGRGANQSICILLSEPNNDIAKARIQTMVKTEDGFEIAERDLELRGPGEFLGVRQSGLPQFTVGDIVKDQNMMTVAREDATSMLSSSSFWLSPRFEKLRGAVTMLPEHAFYRD